MARWITVRLGERDYNVEIESERALVNGRPLQLDSVELDDRCGLSFRRNGQSLNAVLEQGVRENFVQFRGHELPVEIETERERLLKRIANVAGEIRHHAEIRASMPGLVLRMGVKHGHTVTKGQAVLILEAMKMENEIRAPVDGVVREIHVQPGQPVEKGDLLMVLE